eukprot:224782-Pelagomonas_calceolata.AAC.1
MQSISKYAMPQMPDFMRSDPFYALSSGVPLPPPPQNHAAAECPFQCACLRRHSCLLLLLLLLLLLAMQGLSVPVT